METTCWHPWRVDRAEALELQQKLAGKVCRTGDADSVRYIAGVDISAGRFQETAAAAVVVMSYPELKPVETRIISRKLNFPYIPGLLSFREAPLILAACARLEIVPDLMMVDGQGIAHPRRLGLASHLGLLLNVPTIGCAKSRLCGRHEAAGIESGSYAELVEGDEVIGAVLRTRHGVKPLYVSIGHRIDLGHAIRMVMDCCRGYRLPEPTRLAHLAAGGNLNISAGLEPARRQTYYRANYGEDKCRNYLMPWKI